MRSATTGICLLTIALFAAAPGAAETGDPDKQYQLDFTVALERSNPVAAVSLELR